MRSSVVFEQAKAAFREGAEVILTIKVKARVVEHHDSHGACAKLVIEKRDFDHTRELWVDADEIQEIE